MPNRIDLAPDRIAVDETKCAQAIDMSLAWVRKDRRTERILPFYRIGKAIRYDMQRVREALAGLEEGGHRTPKPRVRRGVSA